MSNEFCKCGKVGIISCPNDERCGKPINQLPAEVQERIKANAEAATVKHEIYLKHLQPNYDIHSLFSQLVGYKAGYIASSISYASEIVELKKELHEKQCELLRQIGECNAISKELQQWKHGKEVENG